MIKLENDYTLELEALLLRRREVVGTYTGKARIRHRYNRYANRAEVNAAGVEAAVRRATRGVLAGLAADAERIRGEAEH